MWIRIKSLQVILKLVLDGQKAERRGELVLDDLNMEYYWGWFDAYSEDES